MPSEEEAVKAFFEALERETKALTDMSEEDRFTYIKGIIESLGSAIHTVALEKPRLKQAKLAEALLKELNDNAAELIPPIIYSIKPEFQPVYVNLLNTIAGNVKEQ